MDVTTELSNNLGKYVDCGCNYNFILGMQKVTVFIYRLTEPIYR